MEMLGRIIALFRTKFRGKEDPAKTLDLAYENMLTGLQEIRRQLADVVAQRKQLEHQIAGNDAEIAGAEQEASLAIKSNRDDLAKAALMRRRGAADKKAALQAALDALLPQVQKLTEYQQQLADRIDRLRTDKETMRVSTAAAEAQLKVAESLTGLSGELGGLAEARRRTEDKMLDARARAGAMDRMIRDGVLDDPLTEGQPLPTDTGGIDDDLALLKSELTPKSLAAPRGAEDKQSN
jgi:phage shock protein A